MKSLLLYPLVTLLATTILMIYWIFVTAYMASAGNNVAESAAYLSASVRGSHIACRVLA